MPVIAVTHPDRASNDPGDLAAVGDASMHNRSSVCGTLYTGTAEERLELAEQRSQDGALARSNLRDMI